MTLWRLLHLLSLCLMMAGVGGTLVPIWRAGATEQIERRVMLLEEAHKNETLMLLPGTIALMFSGYAWATASGINVIVTWWLVALQVLTMVDLFIFIPLMGVGLRRVRYLALAAEKQGKVTDELRDAMADNVPLVFSTLIAITIPFMVWLPVFKPF
ncbi:MAG: DUF2269 family protein [Dehalococcoidia bacterium]